MPDCTTISSRYYGEQPVSPELEYIRQRLEDLSSIYENAVDIVTEEKDTEYIDFHARRLVEMAATITMSYLLLGCANDDEMFRKSLIVYVNHTNSEVEKHFSFIAQFKKEDLGYYKYVKNEESEIIAE